MPLKHSTETFLVIVLGAAILVTGILLATLPPLMAGLVPMLILLAITFIYPIALYPFLRSNRADYPFRLLHFFPAVMVLVWGLLQLLGVGIHGLAFLSYGFTWGWTLGAVLIGFFLLMVFCVQVLRRWSERLLILAIFIVVFTALSLASALNFHWDQTLASNLWQGKWWDVTGSGSHLIAQVSSSSATSIDGKNLSSSGIASEEQWRAVLRAFEQSQQSTASSVRSASSMSMLAQQSSVMSMPPMPAMVRSSSSASFQGIITGITPGFGTTSSSSSSSSSFWSQATPSFPTTTKPVPPPVQKPVAIKPPRKHLPQSGPAEDALVFLCMAGFVTAVHRRASKRIFEV